MQTNRGKGSKNKKRDETAFFYLTFTHIFELFIQNLTILVTFFKHNESSNDFIRLKHHLTLLCGSKSKTSYQQ